MVKSDTDSKEEINCRPESRLQVDISDVFSVSSLQHKKFNGNFIEPYTPNSVSLVTPKADVFIQRPKATLLAIDTVNNY